MTGNLLYEPVRLSKLLSGLEGVEIVHGSPDAEVLSVEYDSREVKSGSLFVAIEGFESDGHRYLKDAVERGANSVVISDKRLFDFGDLKNFGVSVFTSDNTRSALSGISAAFFGKPTLKVPVVGITGTNGKTSTAYMLEAIFSRHGYSPGVIGTVNHRWKGNAVTALNTTPESKDLNELIFRMIDDGVDIIIMEVSSHGLELNRVDDIEFDIAVFTNLTRDHLDFHNSFDDYFNAKNKIFQILERSSKIDRTGIVNIDDKYGKKILNQRNSFSYPLVSFGIEADADYFPVQGSIRNSINGISYMLQKPEEVELDLRLSGRFNVYNSICAVAAARTLQIPLDIVKDGISGISSIPGRFDRITSSIGFDVIIDYAHTNDALLKLLQSVRELEPARLITVFGCGGNRDRSKRPLMGRIAVENSDMVIVTSDNPRMEEPDAIIHDIVDGLDTENFEIIPDREEAIRKAVRMAGESDIVVVAGKGHEDYQILGAKRIHFDDCEIAEKYIRERETDVST